MTFNEQGPTPQQETNSEQDFWDDLKNGPEFFVNQKKENLLRLFLKRRAALKKVSTSKNNQDLKEYEELQALFAEEMLQIEEQHNNVKQAYEMSTVYNCDLNRKQDAINTLFGVHTALKTMENNFDCSDYLEDHNPTITEELAQIVEELIANNFQVPSS